MADRRYLDRKELNEKEKFFWDNHLRRKPSFGKVMPLYPIPRYQKIVEDFLLPLEGKRVLEIGCNSGYLCYYFADRGASVTGVDISGKAIETAREIKALNPTKCDIEFQQSPAESLPFEDGYFDVLFSRDVLHHTDFRKSLEECGRVVKRGGKIVLAETTLTNFLIRLGRDRIIGKLGSKAAKNDTEYPLSGGEIDLIRKKFGSVEVLGVDFFRLLLRIPFFRKKPWPGLFSAIDDFLFLKMRGLNFLSYEKIFLITNDPQI